MYDLECGTRGLLGACAADVDEGPAGFGGAGEEDGTGVLPRTGGRVGAASVVLLGVRDWPEKRVSGDAVRLDTWCDDDSAATRGLGIAEACGIDPVGVVAAGDLPLAEAIFQGDDCWPLPDLSHAIFGV